MQIAIISDVHDNLPSLKKVLDYCAQNKIEKIICCGDLTSQESLDFLNDNFEGEIFFVFGNADKEHFKNSICHPEFNSGSGLQVAPGTTRRYKKTNIFEEFGEADFEGLKVAFVHFPEEAKRLAESGKYDFVFHGHTHKPWTEKIGKCEMLNPGNVAGTFYPPTFAVWNTDSGKFELIRIHDLK